MWVNGHHSSQELTRVGHSFALEPKMRIELTTYALRVRCSTPELPGRVIRTSVYWREPSHHHGSRLLLWKADPWEQVEQPLGVEGSSQSSGS